MKSIKIKLIVVITIISILVGSSITVLAESSNQPNDTKISNDTKIEIKAGDNASQEEQKLEEKKFNTTEKKTTTEQQPEKKQLSINEIAKLKESLVLIKVYTKNYEDAGGGSGFIVSDDGKVITNYHVIEAACDYSVYRVNGDDISKSESDKINVLKSESDKINVFKDVSRIEVITSDDKVHTMTEILAYDEEKDIAIIKFDNQDKLPFLKLGNSDKVQLGDSVVAIGSPIGLKNTVSTGIVSNFNNPFDEEGFKWIQTTAPISPGSSGGALFNMNGEVIGITAASYFFMQNLNFAIPINYASELLNKISDKDSKKVVDYSRTENYINNTCKSTPFDEGTLESSHITLGQNLLDKNSVVVTVNLDDYNFQKYLISLTLNGCDSVRGQIESTLEKLADKILQRYPDKAIVGSLTYVGTVKNNNLRFPSDSISYNEESEGMQVNYDILHFINDNGNNNFSWGMEFYDWGKDSSSCFPFGF